MPLRHTFISGMTQLSGKSTLIEGLIVRSGLRAIAFKTKRGESAFQDVNEIPAYLKGNWRDWQYVSSLLEATLRERMKFERSWIIKAVKGPDGQGFETPRSLLGNVKSLREASRADSLSESVYTNLESYLEIVVPQIERFKFSEDLDLGQGLNVMELTEMSEEMQALVIRSVMEYVLAKLKDTIIVIPEAWKFCPQRRSTPVKDAIESFTRQGAGIGLYLWADCQDIAGIDKIPLRQVDTWILGRQGETNEIERSQDELTAPVPSADDFKTLPIGHFYARIKDRTLKLYGLPAWMPPLPGQYVAQGKLVPEDAKLLCEAFEQPVCLAVSTIREMTELEAKLSKAEALTSMLKDRVEAAEDEVKFWKKKKPETDTSLREQLEKLDSEAQSLAGVKQGLEMRCRELEESLKQKEKEVQGLQQRIGELLEGEHQLKAGLEGYQGANRRLMEIQEKIKALIAGEPVDVKVQLTMRPTELEIIDKRTVLKIDDHSLLGQEVDIFRGQDNLTLNAVVNELVRRAYWRSAGGPARKAATEQLETLCRYGILSRRDERGKGWVYSKTPDFERLVKR